MNPEFPFVLTVGQEGYNVLVTLGVPLPALAQLPSDLSGTDWYDVKTNGATGNGVTDDTANVQAAMNAAVSAGKTLYWSEGTYLISASLILLSNLVMFGTPGAGIKSTITPSGGPGGYTNSVFFAEAATSAGSTLSATPPVGSTVLDVAATTPFAVGDTIIVTRAISGLIEQQFTVLSIQAGVSLTVDTPTEYSFQDGDSVLPAVVPSNIVYLANGMTISGTGDRAWEVAAGANCYVHGLRVTTQFGSFTSIACSYDVGGRNNTFSDVHVAAGGVSAAGVALECQVKSEIVGCRVSATAQATTNPGFYLVSAMRCTVRDSHAWLCGQGAWMTYSIAGDSDACGHNVVSGCQLYSNVNNGIEIDGGSSNAFESCGLQSNGANGLLLAGGGGGAPSVNVRGTNLDVSGCATSGLNAETGAITAEFANLTANGTGGASSTGGGVLVGGIGAIVTIDGYWSDDAPNVFEVNAAATLAINRGVMRNVALNGAWGGQLGAANAILHLNDCLFEYVAGTGTKAICQLEQVGCTIYLNDVQSVGAFGYGVFSQNGVATKTYRGANVDLSSCTTPYDLDASSLANFGSFTLNGVTQVAVTGVFPQDSSIAWSLKTVGSTPGIGSPYFSAATTSGAFYVKSPTAAANDVYNWHAY